MAISPRSQEFTASGTFNVPAGVVAILVTATAGGAAGGGSFVVANDDQGGGGGGSGEFCRGHPLAVTPGGTVAIVVGAAGVGVTAGRGTNGGATTITGSSLTISLQGGFGGSASSDTGVPPTCAGGGLNGGSSPANLNPGIQGTAESLTYYGGSSGGGNSTGANVLGNLGGACETYPGGPPGTRQLFLAFQAGGSGGGSSPWGIGGLGGDGHVAGHAPAAGCHGAGGGGAGGGGRAGPSLKGGDGLAGYVLIEWIEP